MFAVAVCFVLVLHLLFIWWIIFGAALTGGRRWLAALHMTSLIYAAAIEAGPWSCPLTLFEGYIRQRGGMTDYREPFLVHYLEATVYPHVSELVLAWCAVAICCANFGIYLLRWRRERQGRSVAGSPPGPGSGILRRAPDSSFSKVSKSG